MLQAINTTATAVAAGATVPLSLDFNTNACILDFDTAANAVTFVKQGIYKVTANFVYSFTAAGTGSIAAYSGLNPVPGMISTITKGAAGDTTTFSIEKLVRITPISADTDAEIHFVSSIEGTLNNAVVSVEKVR